MDRAAAGASTDCTDRPPLSAARCAAPAVSAAPITITITTSTVTGTGTGRGSNGRRGAGGQLGIDRDHGWRDGQSPPPPPPPQPLVPPDWPVLLSERAAEPCGHAEPLSHQSGSRAQRFSERSGEAGSARHRWCVERAPGHNREPATKGAAEPTRPRQPPTHPRQAAAAGGTHSAHANGRSHPARPRLRADRIGATLHALALHIAPCPRERANRHLSAARRQRRQAVGPAAIATLCCGRGALGAAPRIVFSTQLCLSAHLRRAAPTLWSATAILLAPRCGAAVAVVSRRSGPVAAIVASKLRPAPISACRHALLACPAANSHAVRLHTWSLAHSGLSVWRLAQSSRVHTRRLTRRGI